LCQCHWSTNYCSTTAACNCISVCSTVRPYFWDNLKILGASWSLLLAVQIIIFLAAIENLLPHFAKRRPTVASPEAAPNGRLSETRSAHARMFGCHKRYLNIIGVIVSVCQVSGKAGIRLGTRH
jgi:hypothetical protein